MPYVASINAATTTLHIPQLRVSSLDGRQANSAYDIDLQYFIEDGNVLFDIVSVTQVAPISVCPGATTIGSGNQSGTGDVNVSGGDASIAGAPSQSATSHESQYIVIAYNDLGMHCMNQDHSILSILPPANNIMAQVIRRGDEPKIITHGIRLEYRLLENTTCSGTNFWDYAGELFGERLEFCTGLSGNGLSGEMILEGSRFIAKGVPVTPFDDSGNFNPYPLAEVVVKDSKNGQVLATTQTVVPISYEMNCHKCHGGDGGQGTMLNILKLHDQEEGTDLEGATPVLCQECHADPALGSTGSPGVPNFSLAIHGKHAEVANKPGCYDCHPGPITQCQRTAIEGMQTCSGCHGELKEMARALKAGRRPWLDEPKCSDCHSGQEIDTGNNLYRNAKGHHGVYCETCHYEPHAWWPSKLEKDNQQPLDLQGGSGPLGSKSCLVCHASVPEDDEGPHGLSSSGMYGGSDDAEGDDD